MFGFGGPFRFWRKKCENKERESERDGVVGKCVHILTDFNENWRLFEWMSCEWLRGVFAGFVYFGRGCKQRRDHLRRDEYPLIELINIFGEVSAIILALWSGCSEKSDYFSKKNKQQEKKQKKRITVVKKFGTFGQNLGTKYQKCVWQKSILYKSKNFWH